MATHNRIEVKVGDRCGALTIVGFSHRNKHNQKIWNVRCDCGVEETAAAPKLHDKRGRGALCSACARQRPRGVKENAVKIGERHEKLTVVSLFERRVQRTNGNSYPVWLCRCDCGAELRLSGSEFRAQLGCYQCGRDSCSAKRTKHGDASRRNGITALYDCWCSMRARCENPNQDAYKFYGARGISVCAEWKSYPTFRAWALANGFRQGLTIERRDTSKHYQPDNCEWITASENSRRASVGRWARQKFQRRHDFVLGQMGLVA